MKSASVSTQPHVAWAALAHRNRQRGPTTKARARCSCRRYCSKFNQCAHVYQDFTWDFINESGKPTYLILRKNQPQRACFSLPTLSNRVLKYHLSVPTLDPAQDSSKNLLPSDVSSVLSDTHLLSHAYFTSRQKILKINFSTSFS